MSATGRNPSEVRKLIQQALDGATITGTAIQVTLNKAADPLNPLIGGRECVDGAFVVVLSGASSYRNITHNAGAVHIQHKFTYRVTVRCVFDVAACSPENMDADLYVVLEGLVDLIDDCLQPLIGEQFEVLTVEFRTPERVIEVPEYLASEVTYVISEWWDK